MRPSPQAALVLLGACMAPTATLSRTVVAMGTTLQLEVEAKDRATCLMASEAAIAAVAAAEARLSTWRPDAELERLNATPAGVEVSLSESLARELGAAARIWRDTDDAFDPGVGALVHAYDLRGQGRWPAAAELERARADSGLRWLTLADGKACRTRPGLRLEEGGFGKGAALDAALAAARRAGATAVFADFGGQLLHRGPTPHRAAIADPQQRDVAVLELALDGGSLSISGNSERGLTVDGRSLPHLLDPRTGLPAPERGSFAVLAADALTADALSTGLYVAGFDQACRYVAAHPDCGVAQIAVAADGALTVRVAGALRGRLRACDPRVRFAAAATAPAHDLASDRENQER